MNRKIEDFVKEHKKEFESDRPTARLWEKIAEELDHKIATKRRNIQLWMAIASSIIILLGITLTTFIPQQKKKMGIEDISPVYASKQVEFTSMIEEKRDSLEIFADTDPELYHKFNTDLEQLHIAYEGLRKQLSSGPNRQQIVKAMIKNLETQLHLVSQQLTIITEVREFRKENRI